MSSFKTKKHSKELQKTWSIFIKSLSLGNMRSSHVEEPSYIKTITKNLPSFPDWATFNLFLRGDTVLILKPPKRQEYKYTLSKALHHHKVYFLHGLQWNRIGRGYHIVT